jgi:hypothetical protein
MYTDEAQFQLFLENELQLHLENVPLQTGLQMWIQHDGTPPHISRKATKNLNANYQGRWINCMDSWVVRDHPTGLSFMGCMKFQVYHTSCKQGYSF